MGKVREGNEVSMAAHMPMHDMIRGSCVHRREDRKRLKAPSGTSGFKAPRLVMPEQRNKKNDRKWNSEQPKQCTSTETHVSLHVL
jgi:hypothetical protein